MAHQLVESLRSQTRTVTQVRNPDEMRSLIGHISGILKKEKTLGRDQKKSLRGFRRNLRAALKGDGNVRKKLVRR